MSRTSSTIGWLAFRASSVKRGNTDRISPASNVCAASTLDRSDRLHSLRSADRRRRCFRKAEVLDLTFLNQVFHRSRYIFNRYVSITTVLIEEIGYVRLEAFERCIGNLLDVLRPAVAPPP